MAIVAAYRLSQRMVFNGTIVCFNVFHLFGQTEERFASEVAVDWRDNIVDTWKINTSAFLRFESVSVLKIHPYTGDAASVALTGTGNLPSSSTGPPVVTTAPAPIAGVITWRSARPGRSFRGRTFLAGLQLTHNDGQVWHQTQLNAMGNIATAIRNRYELGGNPYGLELGVLSRTHTAAQPEGDPPAIWKVIAHTVQQYYATMGSRRSGRGM